MLQCPQVKAAAGKLYIGVYFTFRTWIWQTPGPASVQDPLSAPGLGDIP